MYINYMKIIINNVIQYNMAGIRDAIVFFIFFAIAHVLTKRVIDWTSSKMSVSLEKKMKASFFLDYLRLRPLSEGTTARGETADLYLGMGVILLEFAFALINKCLYFG